MKLDLLFLNDEGLEKEMSENPSESQIGVPVKEGEVGWWSDADRYIDEVVWGVY